MSARRFTQVTLVIVLIVLLVVEGIVLFNKEPDDTISEVIQDWAFKALFFPYWVGVLGGHWFWPGKRYLSNTAGLICLTILMCGFMAIDWWVLGISPIVILLIGIPLGHWLWALPRKENS